MWKGLSLSAQFSWMAKRYVMNNDRFFEEVTDCIVLTINQEDYCMIVGKKRVTLRIFPVTE